MTKVDPTAQLIDALRAQLLERSGPRKISQSSTSESTRSEEGSGAALGPEQVQRRIGRQLSTVDLNDLGGKRLARRIFVETVLTFDLGDHLLNDPRFNIVVKDVEESLSGDEATAQTLDAWLLTLKGSTAPP